MQIMTRGSLTAALFAFALNGSIYAQTAPQNFISVTPCRITDTRTSSGGPGPISGGTYRSFTVTGVCNIPTNASAFSLNVTAAPNPSGSSLLFLSVLPATSSTPSTAPSSSTLNDPSGTIIANAAIVPSGVNGAVMVYVSSTSDVILDIDGYFVDQTNSSSNSTALGTSAGGSTGSANTAVGFDALPTGTGGGNSAFGSSSLSANTSGAANIAIGGMALGYNTTGSYNTAAGYGALLYNTSGNYNAAVGYGALENNSTGNNSSAFGLQALLNETDGGSNDAFGSGALGSLTTGSGNVGIGNKAGLNVTTGSNNIEIGNVGNSNDSGVIRIGTGGSQGTTFIAGIYGATAASGSTVLISSNGLLGTFSSSIRFKEDVHEMGDSTDALMQLRPVEFRYKQAAEDGTKPLQFGLIAEEVAKVYPELVVRGSDGQIDSVKYHELPAMLLNEIQKQHRTIEDLKAEIDQLRALIANK